MQPSLLPLLLLLLLFCTSSLTFDLIQTSCWPLALIYLSVLRPVVCFLPPPSQTTSPSLQKKKRKVIALFCDQPPPSPVLCLAPPTGGRCFWLTCLLFFLSLSVYLSLALSPSTQSTLSRLSAKRPVYMLLWHFLGCTSFHDLCMQGPKVTFCHICQWRVTFYVFIFHLMTIKLFSCL